MFFFRGRHATDFNVFQVKSKRINDKGNKYGSKRLFLMESIK